jgi:ABC-type oligopeptide transport system substrate-binding subunit
MKAAPSPPRSREAPCPRRGTRRGEGPLRLVVALCALALAAAAHAADMRKTLHVAFPVAESGFDPQAISDTYSDAVCLAIFDPLYRYDYFA